MSRALRRLSLVAALLIASRADAVQPSRTYAADPKSLGLVFESVQFPSQSDSLPLQGWWFPAAGPAPAVVLCPRGRGNMAEMLPCVREFARRGFAVLAFDPRDFGPGGAGDTDTLRNVIFASRWVDDTEAAFRYARGRSPGQAVVAWGQDLGSSLALSAAARLPGLVEAVAVEGVFRTTEEQLEFLGLSQDAELLHHQRAIMDARDEPFSAASRIRIPAFFVIAGKDEITSPETTRLVASAIRFPAVRWELPGASHDGLEDTPGYFDRLSEWFKMRAKAAAPLLKR